MTEWITPPQLKKRYPVIDCGMFYPGVSPEVFCAEYRIPSDVPEGTVLGHLRQAVIRVMRSLSEWKAEQSAETIADIPQAEIDGVGELETLFLRAVYCEAKADLLRETVTVDRKKEAENSGKTAPETEEKYREFAAEAVRLICGLETVGVHLI